MSPPNVVLAAAGDSILTIDASFFFVFISVICLIFILNRTLFRPIKRVLEERERLGIGRSKEAKLMLGQVDERVRSYEAKIRAARAAAYQRVEARRRELKATRQQLVAEAKKQAEAQIAAAREDVSRQAAAARATLEADAKGLAAGISSQILNRPVAPDRVEV
jgi:F-type H+-transporting ATPase subunit b